MHVLETKLSSTGHVGGSVLEALRPSKTCFQLGLAIGSSLRSLTRQGIRHVYESLTLLWRGHCAERSVKFVLGPLQGAPPDSMQFQVVDPQSGKHWPHRPVAAHLKGWQECKDPIRVAFHPFKTVPWLRIHGAQCPEPSFVWAALPR